jgi:lipopolysaccharide/colanic/teichoic acid biosynthesis glycosyltransferase
MKENGEEFGMIKFRTMQVNADKQLQQIMQKDKDGNLVHKRPDDPRVTKIGKFLRKTSLDELPPLINIIKGDMSLIGPRPELPEMVSLYEPWQHKRFTVPQGVTGWWQVNGRSDKPMHLNTQDDLYYIQHYSIWLDLQILLKTILVVIRGKGAF